MIQSVSHLFPTLSRPTPLSLPTNGDSKSTVNRVRAAIGTNSIPDFERQRVPGSHDRTSFNRIRLEPVERNRLNPNLARVCGNDDTRSCDARVCSGKQREDETEKTLLTVKSLHTGLASRRSIEIHGLFLWRRHQSRRRSTQTFQFHGLCRPITCLGHARHNRRYEVERTSRIRRRHSGRTKGDRSQRRRAIHVC